MNGLCQDEIHQGGSQTCLYEGWSSPAHYEALSSDNKSKAMNFTSRFIFKTQKQWKQLNASEVLILLTMDTANVFM